MADLIAHIDQRIRRALSGLRLAYRAVLSRVTPIGGVQTAQLSGLAGESTPDVELFQHYGLTSVPPAGTMAVVLPVGGRTRHSIVIATEHSTYRLQGLESGEVALYTDEGTSITLKRHKIIAVECDDYQVTCKRYQVNAEERAGFETPMLSASQALTAEGPIAKKLNYGYTDFMSYSIDFRRRILSIKKHEGLSIRETAKRFHIGTTTIVRWTKQIDARPATSRQRKIDKSALERDVEQYPDAYQRERAERFGVCQMAICKALKKLQLTYKKNSASSKSRRRR